MRGITVSVLDPDVQVLERGDGTLFVWTLDGLTAESLQTASNCREAAEQLVVESRNASIVFLETTARGAVSLTMWRGLLATTELFYAVLPDGAIVVSDHLRNVLSLVPVADRMPSDDAVIEKYLCGWNYDRRVFAGGADRLGYGDRLDAAAPWSDLKVSIFDRHDLIGDPAALPELSANVEAALETSLDPWKDDPNVAVTFSGGVDSTLLASFFDRSAELVTFTIDSPEFAPETEYAHKAAAMMGRSVTEHEILERDYVELLRESTLATVAPSKHYVSPVLTSLDHRNDETIVFGFGADSIFGTDRGLRRIAGAMANGAGLASLKAGGHLPGFVGHRSRQIRSYATKFAAPTDDPRGAAGTALAFGDTTIVDALVGRDAVDRIFESQLQFVLDRVQIESEESNRFWRHTEIVQWRDTMSDNSSYRRLSTLAGKTRGVLPYTDATVINTLLAAPADKRYIRGLAGKWVLKDILSRRVPDYPVNQRKNATGLPFERYVADGPLTGIWDRYDVPDIFNGATAKTLRETPTHVSWQALAHSVWLQEVGKNANLQALPARHEVAVPFSSGVSP